MFCRVFTAFVLLLMSFGCCQGLESKNLLLVLDSEKNLHLFDNKGEKLGAARLAGPDVDYMDFTVGDFDTDLPGNEIVVLRKDGLVDIYQLNTEEKVLKRLKYISLHRYGNRYPVSITSSAVKELMVLQTADMKDGNAVSQHFYTYTPDMNSKSVKRDSYYAVLSRHFPVRALRAVNGSVKGLRLFTLSADNYIETYDYHKGDKRCKRVGGFFKLPDNYKVKSFCILDDSMVVLLDASVVIVNFREGRLAVEKTISLKNIDSPVSVSTASIR